jgi:hypothetical protein
MMDEQTVGDSSRLKSAGCVMLGLALVGSHTDDGEDRMMVRREMGKEWKEE